MSTKASIIIYKIVVDMKIPATYFNLLPEKNMCIRIIDRCRCDVVDEKIRVMTRKFVDEVCPCSSSGFRKCFTWILCFHQIVLYRPYSTKISEFDVVFVLGEVYHSKICKPGSF